MEEDSLAKGIEFLDDNPAGGLVTLRTTEFDGKLQRLCKREPTLWAMAIRSFSTAVRDVFFPSRTAWFEMHDSDYRVVLSVRYPTGHFKLVRMPVFEINRWV